MAGRGVRSAVAALLLVGGCAIATAAQTTTGSVTGSVKDTKGGVIPGAAAVMTSETRGIKVQPVFTNGSGDFIFVNVTPDTYTLEVSMDGFKTLKRAGVVVNSNSRAELGSLTIEVGGKTETVDVTAEAPVIQAQSGERSFTVSSTSVENLPIANRSFTALASLAPGVAGNDRIGGGGSRNIMMDGVSTMDTGSNSILLQMNVESIAEVKVLVSGYQAEFGRSAGVQITAVTKSGTNRFRGSVYDVERNSDWNENSKNNLLNGNAKGVSKDRDWGYSIGGPIGKQGGNNRLFFFYSHEYAPRQSGGNTQRFRMPTALERQGDFSLTTDNNGNLYNFIKDPRVSGGCNANTQVACFADGGVLGRIPKDQLNPLGLAILSQWPLPNISPVPAGQSYNYEFVRPVEKALAWQPAVRIDYQPSQALRLSYKYSGWRQRNQTFNGSLPGWTDAKMQNPVVNSIAVSGNYTINQTTFLEAIVGRSGNELAGCALAQGGTGPSFCTGALPMSQFANRTNIGLANLPFLYPDAQVLDTRYYAYDVMNKVKPPMWDGRQMLMAPGYNWGNRVSNSPPGYPFPGYLNINQTWDVNTSITKVAGRHTFKAGFYNTHSWKAQQSGGWNGTLSFSQDTVGTNAFDTSYGYANAAIGSFSSYQQKNHYIEHSLIYNNTEGFIQDNWKISNKLTLDYGMRIVRQQPVFDKLQQGANFLPEKWDPAQAPQLYVAGCQGASPCSGTSRQAMDPRNGQLLGPNTTLAIGAIVPGTGNLTNALFQPGKEIVKTVYTWPLVRLAPRVGAAYDLSGSQTFVFRGGMGLFFDRPSAGGCGLCSNPPSSVTTSVRYGQLQSLGSSGLSIAGVPSLSAAKYHERLPSSFQWNGGIQMTLPWSTALDVEYAGSHGFNNRETWQINGIDLGAAFLASTQDTTVTPSATPGATSLVATNPDLVRFYRGYGTIGQTMDVGWRTYHSIQIAFNRRFRNGISFGFNDTIGLYDRQNSAVRLEHVNGVVKVRDDQAKADELLGNNYPTRHTMKGNFVWDMPDIRATGGILRVVGMVANDWQLSGIWSATTGNTYTIDFSYQSGGNSVSLTGSPDFSARTRVVGTTGGGCNYNDLYRQFTTSSFQGPLVNSVGLESGEGYLRGCFSSTLDLAVARNIRLPRGRNIQLRLDMFNAPNEGKITGRQTTMNLTNPTDPVTISNLPFDAAGNLLPNRVRPTDAGFGAVSGYQGPRTVQAQVRFSF